MFMPHEPLPAARYDRDFGPTQMVDWLTAQNVRASREPDTPFLMVSTATGMVIVPFGAVVVVVGTHCVVIAEDDYCAAWYADPDLVGSVRFP